MPKILHITAHLGGGVGKVISGLVAQAAKSKEFEHKIICLEKPQKSMAIDKIRNCGGEVVISPYMDELESMMLQADIVQLNWWDRPATIDTLCSLSKLPIRLLTWWHQSGLHSLLPKKLMKASHIFLFTSSCSYDNVKVKNLVFELRDRLGVVYSSGGFDGFPEPRDRSRDRLSAGYIGTLDFKKIYPDYVQYLTAVSIPGFKVKMIGDLVNQRYFEWKCNAAGRRGMMEFTGYVPDVILALESINVLAYILNPVHYGTTENALLEAMAMGIVPVVLDNPAEKYIVEDGVTGLIIKSPEEFAEAIQWLSEHPHERQAIGMQASKTVRERFSVEKTEAGLNRYYRKIMQLERRDIDFKDIFRPLK